VRVWYEAVKILITGRNRSGSFIIRGEQLGAAIGATVDLKGSSKGFDLTVVVKRLTPDVLARVSGNVVVDVVDAWPQPAGNDWDRKQSMAWLRDYVGRVNLVGIVAATQQMAVDCKEFGVPVLCLPHHARPNQEWNAIRDQVHVVGYEGGEQHLGRWKRILERECANRGWRFVVNPIQLADLDIVVALREFTGYPARNWKSNVKLANAQATGTPCILSPERGYLETQSGAEYFVEDHAGLSSALDALTDYKTRAVTSRILHTAAPDLSAIAEQYKAWLSRF